jgi:hypothetical protein
MTATYSYSSAVCHDRHSLGLSVNGLSHRKAKSVNRERGSIDISVRDIDTATSTENNSEVFKRAQLHLRKKCVLEHEEIKLRHLYQNLLGSVSLTSVTLSAAAIGAARAHARHQIPAMASLARSFEGRALKENVLELKITKAGGRMPCNIYILTDLHHCTYLLE